MVGHIVMWQFKEDVKKEDKEKLKADMSDNLKSLVGQIDGLKSVEFVKEPLEGTTHDMALITVFDTEESKKAYSTHPKHVHVANTFVRPYVHNRVCLDYNL